MYIELLPEVEYKFNNLTKEEKIEIKYAIKMYSTEKIILSSKKNIAKDYLHLPSVKMIFDYIETESGLKYEDLIKKKRTTEYVEWRHYACYLLKRCCHIHLTKIGGILQRDHTTVLHSINYFKDNIQYKLYKPTYLAFMRLQGDNLTEIEQAINLYLNGE